MGLDLRHLVAHRLRAKARLRAGQMRVRGFDLLTVRREFRMQDAGRFACHRPGRKVVELPARQGGAHLFRERERGAVFRSLKESLLSL